MKSRYSILSRFFYSSFLLLFPLMTSCSSNQNQMVEIISPPIFPNQFSSIPDGNHNVNLKELDSADKLIGDVEFGRKDPFLSPLTSFKGGQPLIPDSFKFQGQIATGDSVNAFVSFQGRSGTLEIGDIGGESTELIPLGWIVKNIDFDSNILTLEVDDEFVNVDLFPAD